jgi:DNA-binding response OmpR family regulator
MLLSKRFVEPRVLLIEDAEETQELSRLALESQACQVTAVSSAEAALGLLNAGEPFDLLFTDVCLGGISGIETANRVREHLPQLPILVTSGMDQHHVLPQLRAGIHFLPKPYSMSELLDAIRLCFRHAADAALMPPPQASAA